MTNLSTYLESPNQLHLYENIHFNTIILDLPFCSIRAHHPYDWTNAEIQRLSENLIYEHLAFNLDGIYTDDELLMIESTLKDRQLPQYFSACRIQDPGLIIWLQEHFPNLNIQLNPETGAQNTPGIGTLQQCGIHRFILNHETPYSVIKTIRHEFPSLELETLVQGPILIQYSKRQFLSNYYESNPNTPIRVDAEDQDLPQRKFTFLNTSFGHFMFAQFHRSLANHSDKLTQLKDCTWLIDARGETDQYLRESMVLYTGLINNKVMDIQSTLHSLFQESNKPQKPGFFLSNNTDYDWRNESSQSKRTPIGHIISTFKGDSTCLEFYEPVDLTAPIQCMNPDMSETWLNTEELCTLDHEPVNSITPFTPYLLPPQKGVQIKAKLFQVVSTTSI